MSLIIAALVLLTSCNGTGNTENEQTAESSSELSVPEQAIKASLTVAGEDIGKYTIVYARSELYEVGKTLTTEYNFYKLIAEEINTQIYTITGNTLTLVQDTESTESRYEILVGPTNRAESDVYDGMDVYSCKNYVKNGKLAVGGGYNATYLTADRKTGYCWAATYHAFDFVKEYIAQAVNGGSDTADLAEGFEQKESIDPITVACIGDSITDGAQASNREITSWPSVLQRILWKDYVVINLGYGGKAISSKYKDTVCYNALSKYGESFDIAMIMLGTNDSNRDRDFSSADDASFNDSALELAKNLTKRNTDLKLTIMNCPVYYGSDEFGNAHVRDLQKKLVKLLSDAGYDSELFDMYEFTKKELTVTRFPDKLHPNAEGYAIMAERLSRLVPELLGEEDTGM